MFFNRKLNRIGSDTPGRNARMLDPLSRGAEAPKEHRRNINPGFHGGSAAAEARKPHQQHQQHYPLYGQEQRRKSFRNPFIATKSVPLGSAGKRAHVQGQERLPVRDYMGESNRADEPGTGWRLLQALDEFRWREKDRKMRAEGGEVRVFGQHGRKKERDRDEDRERVRWRRRMYSI